MKLILTIILVVAIAYTSYSQSKFLKYKCFEYRYVKNNEKGEFIFASEWKDVDIFVTLKKGIFTIYEKPVTEFTLATKNDEYLTVNNDTWYIFQGIDKDGISCGVRFLVFKAAEGKQIGTVYVDYKNVTYVYRLKNVDEL